VNLPIWDEYLRFGAFEESGVIGLSEEKANGGLLI